ncbi:MAG: FAD:protein FMN transferase [Chloroflexota bacterium]|nr:FAD:protein FMN transferase [Chloroflexota bacterium]
MALDPVAPRLPAAQELPETAFVVPTGLHRTQFRAMGTAISLLLPVDQSEAGTAIVQELFAEWEQTLSRFLPESELSRLNQTHDTPIVVSELLYTVLDAALNAAQATQGVYDPTLQRQMISIGYDRSFDALPSVLLATSITPGRPGGGWRRVQLDAVERSVTLPRDVGLDFGGIAKGMAVDAALARLREAGIETSLVNAGGDLALLGVPADAGEWQIAVPGKDKGWSIPLHHGAMATSGIARRHWQQGRQQRHHLLDPRTGVSAQSGLWSVTAVAARCEQAEIAAKVAFILGLEQGADFLRAHGFAGLLVSEDGCWETVAPWPVHLMREEEDI